MPAQAQPRDHSLHRLHFPIPDRARHEDAHHRPRESSDRDAVAGCLGPPLRQLRDRPLLTDRVRLSSSLLSLARASTDEWTMLNQRYRSRHPVGFDQHAEEGIRPPHYRGRPPSCQPR